MDSLESGNQCGAATIGSQYTTMQKVDKGKRPENITVEITETSCSCPSKDPNEHDSSYDRTKYLDTKSVQLYQAALKGDWKAAKTIIDEQNDIVRKKITKNSEIALHIAVAAKRKAFVKNLLGEMKRKELKIPNDDNNTALHFAAATGVVKIAKMLVKRNKKLPNIPGGGGMTPIYNAAMFGHGEMVIYLYKETTLENLSDRNLEILFLLIVAAEIYDVALTMLKKMAHKKFAICRNEDGDTALHLMARKPLSISHKSKLNLFQNLANYIYKGFFHEAKMGTSAHGMVEELWKSVVQLPVAEIEALLRSPSRILFVAAESGNVELLVILIRSFPDLIWKVDDKSRSLFHVAALNRHESIFKILNELGGIKGFIATYIEDNSKNNFLHLVARLPPPDRLRVVPGAALQMQRELRWFEAVEEIVPRSYIRTKNTKGHIARDLFTKEHRTLRTEGEKWMKETATACMLVATLIATVVFAAALAVPGGYDDESTGDGKMAGFPRFRKNLWFDMFILADLVSLLSSVTAIMIFLSILTSRYAEDDFRTALPTKLMFGHLALFVSIISMVLAFTLTIILIRDEEQIWSLILTICLASLTAISLAYLNFQLLFEAFRSVYRYIFFFHGRKSGIFF